MADAIGILDTSCSEIEREGTNNLKMPLRIAEFLQPSPKEREFF